MDKIAQQAFIKENTRQTSVPQQSPKQHPLTKEQKMQQQIINKFEAYSMKNQNNTPDPFRTEVPIDNIKNAKTMFNGPFMQEIYNQFLIGNLEPNAFQYLRNFPKLYFTLPEPKNDYINLILCDIQKKIVQTQRRQQRQQLKQLQSQTSSQEDLSHQQSQQQQQQQKQQPQQQEKQQEKQQTIITNPQIGSESSYSSSEESDSDIDQDNGQLVRRRQDRQLLRKTLEISQFQSKQIAEEKKSQAIIEEKLKKFQFKENYQPQKIKARGHINKLRKQIKDNIMLRQNNNIYDEKLGKRKIQAAFNSKLFRNLDELSNQYAKRGTQNRQFKKKFLGNQCIITEAKSNYVANGANSSVNNQASKKTFNDTFKKSENNLNFKHQKQFYKRYLTENADHYVEAIQDPFYGPTRENIMKSDAYYNRLISRYLNKVNHEKMKSENKKQGISDLQAYIKTGIIKQSDPIEQRKEQYEKIFLENISDLENFDSDFIVHTQNTNDMFHPTYKKSLHKKFNSPQPITIGSYKDYNDKVFTTNTNIFNKQLSAINNTKKKQQKQFMSSTSYNINKSNTSFNNSLAHQTSYNKQQNLQKRKKSVQIQINKSNSNNIPSILLHPSAQADKLQKDKNNNLIMQSSGKKQRSILINSSQNKPSNNFNNHLQINQPQNSMQASSGKRNSQQLNIMDISRSTIQKETSKRGSQIDLQQINNVQPLNSSHLQVNLNQNSMQKSRSVSPIKQKKVGFKQAQLQQSKQQNNKNTLNFIKKAQEQYINKKLQQQQEKDQTINNNCIKQQQKPLNFNRKIREKIKKKGFNQIERNDHNYSERSGSNDSDNASQTEGYLNYLYVESQDLQNKLQAAGGMKDSLIKKLKFIMRLEENKQNITSLNAKKLSQQ